MEVKDNSSTGVKKAREEAQEVDLIRAGRVGGDHGQWSGRSQTGDRAQCGDQRGKRSHGRGVTGIRKSKGVWRAGEKGSGAHREEGVEGGKHTLTCLASTNKQKHTHKKIKRAFKLWTAERHIIPCINLLSHDLF